MVNKSFHELVDDYINNRFTRKELAEFLKLVQKEEYEHEFKQAVERLLKNSTSKKKLSSNSDANFQSIINSNADIKSFSAGQKIIEERRIIPLYIKKASIAACFAGLIVLSFYLLQHTPEKKIVAHSQNLQPRFKNDVMPGGDKAVLTLADGSTIVLDDAKDGTLTHQGNAKIIKLGAKVLYNAASDGDSKEIAYNTISTPRGGQYQIELPDGTRVWLNAASSLRFPVAFTGKERRVEIDGEAYFEVAKNKEMPFIAKTRGGEIQVLGTHFNVMAYQEEDAVKTTLLEGSVKFTSDKNVSILKPGQQAKLNKEGQLKIDEVDVEPVVAWKNGLFVFDNDDVSTVMRQLSRWYDVDVVYNTKNLKRFFVGEVPRNSKLSDVLKMLEVAGEIRFEIDGKKLIVI